MRPSGMGLAGGVGRRALLGGALLGGALALPAPGLRAQGAWPQGVWPQRNVRIIVPFAAGGTADVPARIMAEHFARLTGQSWIVDNRAGAGGALGIRAVAQATDGHTLLHTTSAVAILPALQRDPGFDPLAVLVPITLTAETPILLAVKGDSRFRDLGEFLAEARAKPGTVSFATSGTGTTVHLAGELLRARGDVDLLHVPFRGSSPATTALLGGVTDAQFVSPLEALPHLRAGRMRALANTAPRRGALLPDVPMLVDAVPGYDGIALWFGLFASRGFPAAQVAMLMQALSAMRSGSALAERLTELGAETLMTGPEALAQRLRQEVPLWQSVAARAGIPKE